MEATVQVVQLKSNSLDLASARGIRRELGAGRRVVVDLSKAKRIDLAGISLLHACQRTLKEEGGDLQLQGLSQDVRRQLDLVPALRLSPAVHP